VLVVPSLFREPFGRVVIEAFAQGVPVIGARSGGIPGIDRSRQRRLSVRSGDDAALARQIADMAAVRGDPRLSRAALEAARTLRTTEDRRRLRSGLRQPAARSGEAGEQGNASGEGRGA
jgi:glycosyltransferase involved in cell wall biosynthesis